MKGPTDVVAGLTNGIEMIKALDRAYGSKGIDEQMDLWTQLQYIKWNSSKQSALDHVVEFKRLVRRTGEVQMPTNSGQQFTMFLNSIPDQDGSAWKARMKGMLRQAPTTTIVQVYDDFVADFRNKDNKDDKDKGKGKSGQNHNNNDGRKPAWKDGKPLCFKCGKYGHKAADCPQKKKDEGGDDSSGSSGDSKAVDFTAPSSLAEFYNSTTATI